MISSNVPYAFEQQNWGTHVKILKMQSINSLTVCLKDFDSQKELTGWCTTQCFAKSWLKNKYRKKTIALLLGISRKYKKNWHLRYKSEENRHEERPMQRLSLWPGAELLKFSKQTVWEACIAPLMLRHWSTAAIKSAAVCCAVDWTWQG